MCFHVLSLQYVFIHMSGARNEINFRYITIMRALLLFCGCNIAHSVHMFVLPCQVMWTRRSEEAVLYVLRFRSHRIGVDLSDTITLPHYMGPMYKCRGWNKILHCWIWLALCTHTYCLSRTMCSDSKCNEKLTNNHHYFNHCTMYAHIYCNRSDHAMQAIACRVMDTWRSMVGCVQYKLSLTKPK